MATEVRLTREFSEVYMGNRYYVRVNNAIVNSFTDTKEGKELATTAYNHAIARVNLGIEPIEVISKEVIENEIQPMER